MKSSYLFFKLNGEQIFDFEELVREINKLKGSVNLEIWAEGGSLIENQAKINEFKEWVVKADGESLLSYP